MTPVITHEVDEEREVVAFAGDDTWRSGGPSPLLSVKEGRVIIHFLYFRSARLDPESLARWARYGGGPREVEARLRALEVARDDLAGRGVLPELFRGEARVRLGELPVTAQRTFYALKVAFYQGDDAALEALLDFLTDHDVPPGLPAGTSLREWHRKQREHHAYANVTLYQRLLDERQPERPGGPTRGD